MIFHLIQVNTAKDWCDEVVKFVRGHAEMSEYNFLRQDNTTQQNVESGGIVKVESPKPEIKTEFEKLIKKEKNENMFDQEIIEKMTENLMDNIDNNLTKDIKQLEIKDEPVTPCVQTPFIFPSTPFKSAQVKKEEDIKTVFPELKGEDKIADSQADPDDDVLLDYEDGNHYRCGFCGYVCFARDWLDVHWAQECPQLSRKPRSLSYKCGLCGSTYPALAKLQFHWRVVGCRAGNNTVLIQLPMPSLTKEEKIRNIRALLLEHQLANRVDIKSKKLKRFG